MGFDFVVVLRGSSQSLGSQPPTTSSQLQTPISSDPWQDVAMKLAADSPLKFGWVEDGCFIERIGNAILVEFPPSLEQQPLSCLQGLCCPL